MSEKAEEQETAQAPQHGASAIHEEVNPDLGQIEAYAKAKQAVARDLHYVHELLERRKSERRHAACRDLMVKLAEDHFTLAVLGQFKRGKSSLMNAIIGRPLLPTGVLPLTSVITALRFGPRERLLVEYEEGRVVNEVPLSELSEYVTEKWNPGNRKGIRRAIIETPSPFLRRGLEFVDTPGVGSAIEANTAITQRFLPQCDAVIFITSVDSPLSKTETEFLAQIREHVRKVLFVVNKTDLLAGSEREEVLQFISENLRNTMGAEVVRVFPLSCQDGLRAKTQGDIEGYERSGLKSLEEALSVFLSTQRMSTFLVSILDRAIAVIDEELHEMEIEARSVELPEEEVQQNLAALQERLEQIRSSYEHDLSSIRERLLAFIKECASREAHALLEREEEDLDKEIHGAATRQRWRLSRGVIRDLGRTIAKRLNGYLDRWAAEVAENVWPLFETSARREMETLAVQLSEIPRAAAEILKLGAAYLAVSDRIQEVEVERNSRTHPPRRLQWQPIIPARFSFLPVLLCRGPLKHYCRGEVERMLQTAEAAVCDAVLARSEEMLEGTVLRVTKLANETEERVKAAVARKVSSSSSKDGGESSAKQGLRLKELRTRLSTLRDYTMQSQTAEADGIISLPALLEADTPAQAVTAPEPSPSPTRAGVVPDLRTRGCPVCDRVQKAMFDFFAHCQYELYASETSQSQFASEGGFCRFHTWQLAATASPQGISQGYSRLVGRIAEEIANAGVNSREAVDKHTGGQYNEHMPTKEGRKCQDRKRADAFKLCLAPTISIRVTGSLRAK
jgi:predicted GTPase